MSKRRNPFGWDYPAGAENDPRAPWNQPPEPDGDEPEQFWHVEDAEAAGKVNERRCIHGKPLNVFCGKCES